MAPLAIETLIKSAVLIAVLCLFPGGLASLLRGLRRRPVAAELE